MGCCPSRSSQGFQRVYDQGDVNGDAEHGVIVVLGQGVTSDSDVLLEARLETVGSIVLDKAVHVDSVIVSSGGCAEFKGVHRVVRARLHPLLSVLADTQSVSTIQSAYACAQIFQTLESPIMNVYLVTSDYHMPRASYLFRAVFQTLLWMGDVTVHEFPSPTLSRTLFREKLGCEWTASMTQLRQVTLQKGLGGVVINDLGSGEFDTLIKRLDGLGSKNV
jgi:hypothetical protein